MARRATASTSSASASALALLIEHADTDADLLRAFLAALPPQHAARLARVSQQWAIAAEYALQLACMTFRWSLPRRAASRPATPCSQRRHAATSSRVTPEISSTRGPATPRSGLVGFSAKSSRTADALARGSVNWHRRDSLARLLRVPRNSHSQLARSAATNAISLQGPVQVCDALRKMHRASHLPPSFVCHASQIVAKEELRQQMSDIIIDTTQKILGDDSVAMTCTAVRVPVQGGHSESVYLEFERDFDLDQVHAALSNFPGVVVVDDPESNLYPMPLKAQGHDEVFVGRIRRDLAHPRGLHLWIVADNLRKGAATNTVQIARYLLDRGRWS